MDNHEKDKGYKTQEDLIKELQALDPSFKPTSNVVSINPNADLDADKINVLNFSDLKSSVPAPIEYVLHPVLPIQGIGFIYAATGIGKTLFTLNLAYAIAQGGNFLKYSCQKPRKVLYVDGEMAFNQVHSRVIQISSNQGELDFEENFSLITPDKILPFRVPQIDDEYGQRVYANLLTKFNIEVVIFDNLSMLSSVDENKSNEWKRVQDWLLYLRSIGKTILVVHHAGKDKNGYRGTSKMLDCADVAISLQPCSDEALEENDVKGKKFKIVYQKARLFGGKEALSFEANLEAGVWSHRSIELSILDRVIESLNAGMTQRDMAKELLISQSTVNRLIKKARITGRVKS